VSKPRIIDRRKGTPLYAVECQLHKRGKWWIDYTRGIYDNHDHASEQASKRRHDGFNYRPVRIR